LIQERQRRIEDAVATAIEAQYHQTAEGARPLHIQEARQEAWFLIYHTLASTTFFQEMFGREVTVIETREQYMYWRHKFLGEVPWDIRNVSTLI